MTLTEALFTILVVIIGFLGLLGAFALGLRTGNAMAFKAAEQMTDALIAEAQARAADMLADAHAQRAAEPEGK